MLQLKKICKKYDRVVLNNISYKFQKGKIYLIKGVSGCGKSTLLNIISGFDNNFEGEVLLEDKTTINIGNIFQDSLLVKNMSIRENLLFFSNNNELNEDLCEQFVDLSLLDKYPNQLSGGERQRISIIRCIQNNPDIIVADEPTASLDNVNSRLVASQFEKMRNENRIIIISSHENCFDEIADEVINLEYGSIRENNNTDTDNMVRMQHNYINRSSKRKKIIKKDFQYIKPRIKKKLKFSKMWPCIAILFILLVCVNSFFNAGNIIESYAVKKYPVNVVKTEKSNIAALEYLYGKNNVIALENYTISEGDVEYFSLYKKEHSCINLDGVIEYGTYPRRKNEIVVSKKFVEKTMKIQNVQDAIGETVEVKGKTFVVSAILSNIKNNVQQYLETNCYYNYSNDNIAFIPLPSMKEIGNINESNDCMVVIHGLFNSFLQRNTIRTRFESNVWLDKLEEVSATIQTIGLIIGLCIFALGIIAFFFLGNSVRLELFYRRREIGFLQIFGLSKKEVRNIILYEKIIQSIIQIIIALIIFVLIGFAINVILEINILKDFYFSIMVGIVYVIYETIILIFPLKKFLKKDVMLLVK